MKLAFFMLGYLSLGIVYAGEKVVIYGDNDYAPYSFVENGQFKGIYVDLLRKVSASLAPDYEIELKPIAWQQGLNALENGTAFALFPPYRRIDRSYISPYSVPLYREKIGFFCTPNVMRESRRRFPADFSGLTIGVNTGFSLGKEFSDALKSGKIKQSSAPGNTPNLKKLRSGQIDCYANDVASVTYSASRLFIGKDKPAFQPIKATEISGQDAHIGYSAIANPPYKADFIDRMNEALLKEMNSTEILKRLLDEYAK